MDSTLETVKLAQQGDMDAKGKLISENSGLIWSIVRKFTGRGVEMEDLFQIGAIGLIKCINKFDTSFNVKFSTYAVPMIMGEIKRFLRDDGMIKVSRQLKEIAVKARYMEQSLYLKNGKYPTVSELAEELGVENELLLSALEATRDVDSIYSTVFQKDGSETYLLDRLVNDDGSDFISEDKITLKKAIEGLSARDRQIIALRYFDDKTQMEISKALGISQVQVSRLEKKILNDIKDKLK
ncbi:SigF/SigG family RNA polymerase sporulation sigma factor [Anaerotignum faecicola]|nr:SigF/SigG family RNA polymerase sporulation sigma factor [Anaerotignum faecicola]